MNINFGDGQVGMHEIGAPRVGREGERERDREIERFLS